MPREREINDIIDDTLSDGIIMGFETALILADNENDPQKIRDMIRQMLVEEQARLIKRRNELI